MSGAGHGGKVRQFHLLLFRNLHHADLLALYRSAWLVVLQVLADRIRQMSFPRRLSGIGNGKAPGFSGDRTGRQGHKQSAGTFAR